MKKNGIKVTDPKAHEVLHDAGIHHHNPEQSKVVKYDEVEIGGIRMIIGAETENIFPVEDVEAAKAALDKAGLDYKVVEKRGWFSGWR